MRGVNQIEPRPFGHRDLYLALDRAGPCVPCSEQAEGRVFHGSDAADQPLGLIGRAEAVKVAREERQPQKLFQIFEAASEEFDRHIQALRSSPKAACTMQFQKQPEQLPVERVD